MFTKIIGKSKAIEELERAEKLIREARDILWRLPSELQLEVSDGNNEVTDSVQDNRLGKWERKVSDLADKTPYDFEFLWGIWRETYAAHIKSGDTDEEAWNYFEGVTMEADW